MHTVQKIPKLIKLVLSVSASLTEKYNKSLPNKKHRLKNIVKFKAENEINLKIVI